VQKPEKNNALIGLQSSRLQGGPIKCAIIVIEDTSRPQAVKWSSGKGLERKENG